MNAHPEVSGAGAPQPPRLLDQLRQHLRARHYSIRTERAYVDWVRRFILFHGKRHPREMAAAEVEAFLTYLAVQRNVAASTQNQAKSALLYLYKQVLGTELPWLDGVIQAKVPRRLPVVLTPHEVRELLLNMDQQGAMWLVASLLYGTGMRLLECLRLRIKDVEFDRRDILRRAGARSGCPTRWRPNIRMRAARSAGNTCSPRLRDLSIRARTTESSAVTT